MWSMANHSHYYHLLLSSNNTSITNILFILIYRWLSRGKKCTLCISHHLWPTSFFHAVIRTEPLWALSSSLLSLLEDCCSFRWHLLRRSFGGRSTRCWIVCLSSLTNAAEIFVSLLSETWTWRKCDRLCLHVHLFERNGSALRLGTWCLSYDYFGLICRFWLAHVASCR